MAHRYLTKSLVACLIAVFGVAATLWTLSSVRHDVVLYNRTLVTGEARATLIIHSSHGLLSAMTATYTIESASNTALKTYNPKGEWIHYIIGESNATDSVLTSMPRYHRQQNEIPFGADGSKLIQKSQILQVPYWCLIGVSIFGLLIWIAVRLSRKKSVRWRLSQGRCAACGYDLRNIRAKCPECGNTRTEV